MKNLYIFKINFKNVGVVYKIGVTNNVNRRVKQYLYTPFVDDVIVFYTECTEYYNEYETLLKRNLKYHLATGKEYYHVNDATHDVMEYISTYGIDKYIKLITEIE